MICKNNLTSIFKSFLIAKKAWHRLMLLSQMKFIFAYQANILILSKILFRYNTLL